VAAETEGDPRKNRVLTEFENLLPETPSRIQPKEQNRRHINPRVVTFKNEANQSCRRASQ
jgi:hypothetical protein